MDAIPERALLYGPRRSLVAVRSEPRAGGTTGNRAEVVILNSGIVHRVGANRMSVPLARALAAAGHPAVRFDLSGIGDTPPRPEALAPFASAIADIRDVLDSLEAGSGARRFILAGLCSGADEAAYMAGHDERVAGVVLLEPTIPRSRRHWLHHYAHHLTRRESWTNLLSGRTLSRALAHRRDRPDLRGEEADLRTQVEETYRRLRNRAIPVLVILSGGSWYYRESFLDAFPRLDFGAHLTLEYLPRADHTFALAAERARVIELVVGWAARTSQAQGRG